jgi:hypothetical protein
VSSFFGFEAGLEVLDLGLELCNAAVASFKLVDDS